MQATVVEATRQYWWLFAVIGALVAVGLVLWRMPSLRASFAAMRGAKPAPARRRVVEAESEYESDSDAGELAEERLLAHLKPAPPPEPEPAPKRRGRKRAEKPVAVTRECTE
jgi:hypothetical protein